MLLSVIIVWPLCPFLCQGYTIHITLLGVYANSIEPLWAVQHLSEIWQTWSYCWQLAMVQISCLGSWFFPTEPTMPFSVILPCHKYFVAKHEDSKTVEQQSDSCHFVDLLLLLRTSCSSNFMQGSLSFSAEPSMPFSGILPCREYFRAKQRRVIKQPKTPVTLMPFCRLVTISKD